MGKGGSVKGNNLSGHGSQAVYTFSSFPDTQCVVVCCGFCCWACYSLPVNLTRPRLHWLCSCSQGWGREVCIRVAQGGCQC
jgi:hypothetical protein